MVWKKPCPPWAAGFDHAKFIVASGPNRRIITRSSKGIDPTRVFDGELQPLQEHMVGNDCYLVGALPQTLIYRVHTEHKGKLVMRHSDNTVFPEKKRMIGKLSFCQNPSLFSMEDSCTWVGIGDLRNKCLLLFNKNATYTEYLQEKNVMHRGM